jgi:hypothetical protein
MNECQMWAGTLQRDGFDQSCIHHLSMGRVGLRVRTMRWHNDDDSPEAFASGLSSGWLQG